MPAVARHAVETAARRTRLAVVAVGLIAVTLTSGCAGKSATAKGTGVDAVGATVYPVGHRVSLPQIDGTTLAGKRLTVPAAASRAIVVINVWASWCTQCQTESPELALLAKSLNGEGVSFVGIDEQDTPDAARTFATKVGMAYPQLVDKDGSILAKLTLLPSFGIPSTLVVDPNEHMAARIIGATDGRQLERIIRQVQRES